MLASKWSDEKAAEYISTYSSVYGEDLALRTYSARLIGAESTLVLHGGGNTSVKSVHKDLFGQSIEAIYVKGSGWDLASIEPAGHPGMDLSYLRKLRQLASLSDESMVNELRTHLFDCSAPTPSVETLLHAFLPHKFIDHSHADAILALTNTVDGDENTRTCFGDQVVYVPYVMPGFGLAKLAAEIFERTPSAIGMVLLRHGLFSVGATARQSYECHLELVNRAEEFVARLTRKKSSTIRLQKVSTPDLVRMLPEVRGRLALRNDDGTIKKRFVTAFRTSDEILQFVSDPSVLKISQTPPLTPDHVIRTKQFPLILDGPVDRVLGLFSDGYDSYFKRCSSARGVSREKLDCMPRVVLIPGAGMLGVGESYVAASIAADIYEHTISVKTRISEYSKYQGLAEVDLFDCEYWSLEQAKLKLQKSKPLSGRVAVISGGAGTIGQGIARILRDAGAEVAITDLQFNSASEAGSKFFSVQMDVTSEASVRDGFAKVVTKFGGVDIIIPNAGVALSAPIEKISEADAKRVMDINFHGFLNTIKVGAEVLRLQGTAGHIVLISSKNVFAPGKEFSIYSASKAAGAQLGKIAAIELGAIGVKVNMINPDAIFGEGEQLSGLWREVGPGRAKARGLELNQLEEFYRQRNILKSKITAEDIGRAVLFFVTDQTPTTGASLPVDGGIAEAFPR